MQARKGRGKRKPKTDSKERG